MIKRRLAVSRPGIAINCGRLSRLNKLFSKKDVRPQIGIGGVFGKLENGEAQDRDDKRATYMIFFILRHGGKIAVALINLTARRGE